MIAAILGFLGRIASAIAQPLILLWAGRRVERGAQAEHANEVKDDQIQAEIGKPRDRSELIDRVRKHQL